MVEVSHGRILLLQNYQRAGWVHAREGCWLRRSVADLLTGVADNLPERWGLAVFDAWRPLELQVELYQAALADPEVPAWLFAEPDPEPSRPPPHLTGGAVPDGPLRSVMNVLSPVPVTTASHSPPEPVSMTCLQWPGLQHSNIYQALTAR